MFKDIAYAFKVFVADPIAYIKDPATAVLAYSITEKAESGVTVTQVETELEAQGFESGPLNVPIVGELVGGVENALTGIGNVLKNLPLYVLIALGIIGAYLVLMGRKGKAVI